jgi:hypothetical protein
MADIIYEGGAGSTITNTTVTGSITFDTAGTYYLENCTFNEVINTSGGAVILIYDNDTTITTNTGPNITLEQAGIELSFVGLDGANIVILDDSDVVQDYQTSQTGSYIYNVPSGATGTWKYCVNRAGYDPIIGSFNPTANDVVVSGTQTEKLTAGGASAYTGSNSVFLTVVPIAEGSRMNLRIGDGTVPPQAIFDKVEDALTTQDGMSYLILGGGEVDYVSTIGGEYLFLKTNVRLIRDNVGDNGATIGAYADSTDGQPLDSSNGDVKFLSVPTSQLLIPYGGFVWVDPVNGTDSDAYPDIGTRQQPCKTWSNAVSISSQTGLKAIQVTGTLTLDTIAMGYSFFNTDTTAELALNGQDVSTCYIEGMKLSGAGVFGTGATVKECVIDSVTGFNGFMNQCVFMNTLSLGSGDSNFVYCISGVPGLGRPSVTLTNPATKLGVRNYSGGMDLEGSTTGNEISLDFYSGTVDFQASCTGGTAVVRGATKIIGTGAGITVSDDSIYTRLEVLHGMVEDSGGNRFTQKALELTQTANTGTDFEKVLKRTAALTSKL